MSSVFTKIINRELPAHIIAEDERHIAILDKNALQWGHTLVIPKNEIDKIFKLPPNELSDLILFAQQIAKAMKKTITCKRIGMTVMGLEVPHAHIHLIPIIQTEKDMNFGSPRFVYDEEKFQLIESKIKRNI